MSAWQAGETTQADILRLRWKQAEEQRDLVAQAMWDARTALGFDPDGDHGFHSTNWEFIAKRHVEEAQEIRAEMDEAGDDEANAITERDNARATAVALDAELLALKALAAEMCSAWNAGETSERTGAAHAALEQAVWVPGATHATYTCTDCGHQWTTDWAVEHASEKRGNVQVTRGATWENKGEAKATYLAVRDPASDRTSPATKGGGW